MGFFSKIAGTSVGAFIIDAIAATALRLKNVSGVLGVRNKADTAYAQIRVSGVVLDDAGTHKVTISQPTTASDLLLTLPNTAGSAGQVLKTDGAGALDWITITTVACVSVDTTALAFGTSSPLTLFTLPANAALIEARVVVDTAFNGTSTVSIGIAGTTSKYTGTGDVDLTTAGEYVVSPGLVPVGSTEALIATYSAGGASAGAARILISYSVPS
jgi:hypothetical protein